MGDDIDNFKKIIIVKVVSFWCSISYEFYKKIYLSNLE